MLFRLMILLIQFKNLTITHKLTKLIRKYLAMMNITAKFLLIKITLAVEQNNYMTSYNYMEQYLVGQVHGVFLMTLLGMLKFLFWIINHYLILVIAKILYLVLGEGSTNNINNNIGAIKKRFCINFSKTIFFFVFFLHNSALQS